MKMRFEIADIDTDALLAATLEHRVGAVMQIGIAEEGQFVRFVEVFFFDDATAQQLDDARAICEAAPFSLTWIEDIEGSLCKVTPSIPIFHATSKITEGEVDVTSDQNWQVIGGVVTDPSFFIADLAKAVGRLICQIKVAGNGAQMRVLEEGGTEADVDMTPTPNECADTSAAWAVKKFSTQVAPRTGDHAYRIEARLNGATSMQVRFASLTLLEMP